MNVQYDLFLPNDEESLLKQEISALREQVDKLRKSQFARLGAMDKTYMTMYKEMEARIEALIERKK